MYHHRRCPGSHAAVGTMMIAAYVGLVAWFIGEMRTISRAVVDIRDTLQDR